MRQIQELTTNRYQILDVLAGFWFTFAMTIIILYGLKLLHMILRRTRSAGFEKLQKAGRWKLEATPQNEWRRETVEARPVPRAGEAVVAEQHPAV